MKNLFRASTLLILLLSIVPATLTFAKGPADLITISGPGLTKPIEITDRTILKQYSPWGDAFFDSSRGFAPEPPRTEQTYKVVMTVNDEHGRPSWIYIFFYVPGPSGKGGYVHLPGPDEEGYSKNHGTIIRNEDGKWLYASDEWDTVARRALKAKGVSIASPSAVPVLDALMSRASTIAPALAPVVRSVMVWVQRAQQLAARRS